MVEYDIIQEKTRKCKLQLSEECIKEGPNSEFRYGNYCKKCHPLYARDYYKKHAAKYKELSKNHYANSKKVTEIIKTLQQQDKLDEFVQAAKSNTEFYEKISNLIKKTE